MTPQSTPVPVTRPKGTKATSKRPDINFLASLWQIVNDPTQDVIQWSKSGRFLIVPDQQKLLTEVAFKHFNQSRYASYARQLNIYGWKRVPCSSWYKIGENFPIGCKVWQHEFLTQGSKHSDIKLVKRKAVNYRQVKREKAHAAAQACLKSEETVLESASEIKDVSVPMLEEATVKNEEPEYNFSARPATPTESIQPSPPVTHQTTPVSFRLATPQHILTREPSPNYTARQITPALSIHIPDHSTADYTISLHVSTHHPPPQFIDPSQLQIPPISNPSPTKPKQPSPAPAPYNPMETSVYDAAFSASLHNYTFPPRYTDHFADVWSPSQASLADALYRYSYFPPLSATRTRFSL